MIRTNDETFESREKRSDRAHRCAGLNFEQFGRGALNVAEGSMSVGQARSAESRVFRWSLNVTTCSQRRDLMRTTMMKVLSIGAVLALAWAGDVRAGLTLSVAENDASLTQIVVAQSGGSFTINGIFLGAPDFTFSNFTVTSTLGATQGELQASGTITDTGAPASFHIVIEDDGYTMPAGPDYVMNGSLSYSSNSLGFLNFFSTANGVNSPGVSFPHPIQGSGSQNDTPTPFTSGSGYSITQTYNWGRPDTGESLTLHGSTIVANAVPEPSSAMLFGLGSIGLVLISRRRRCRREPIATG